MTSLSLSTSHKALNPLASFIAGCQGNHISVYHTKKPEPYFRSEEVLKPEDEDSDFKENIKTIVIHNMKDKFNDAATDDLLNISPMLDPRFKTSHVKPEKVDALKARVVAEIKQEN